METKVCNRCNEEKVLTENFYPSPRNKGGYTTYCKACNTKRAAEKRLQAPNVYQGNPEVDTKVCKECKEEKTMIEFNLQPRNKDGYHHICRDCKIPGDVKRSQKNGYHLKKYGITIDDYNKMREEQDYRCKNPGCRVHESDTAIGKLIVEHCHDTGKVRGLTCSHCNSVEGFSKGDPDVLIGMLVYLGYDLEEAVESFKKRVLE